ncbi:hypothetical protein M9H77_24053 [Catharanthus roseus]|uniref:Uncharacterized protein n=1 Tax=Catharanthus roseus TaxID=4058 RepID=A0ACC0AWS0_CATRO|nr:hypothetical protein M9H77_24053 [Catharanthus roseus]
MKSRPRVIDAPSQDDALQENTNIDESSTIDAMIEDIGTLVHDSRSSEELESTSKHISRNYKMMKLRSNGIPIKIRMKMSTVSLTPASTIASLHLLSTSQPTPSPTPLMMKDPPTT